MVITCDVLGLPPGETYTGDPRGMARKAEAMVKSMGIGGEYCVMMGPGRRILRVRATCATRPRPTIPI